MTTKLDDFLDTKGLTLAHFGIKGMKWGVRRSDAQLKSASSANAGAADAVRARETLNSIRKAKSLSAASDADLNHLVNRLNLEKRFAEVDTSVFQKGHNSVKSALKVGNTMNDALKFANSPAGQLMREALGFKPTPMRKSLVDAAKKGKKKK